jgi:hypothetical protein
MKQPLLLAFLAGCALPQAVPVAKPTACYCVVETPNCPPLSPVAKTPETDSHTLKKLQKEVDRAQDKLEDVKNAVEKSKATPIPAKDEPHGADRDR